MTGRQPRVLLGMVETAGYLANLQAGLGEIGCVCHLIDLAEHPFGYERTAALARTTRWRRAARMRVGRLPRASARRFGWLAATWGIDLFMLGWAIAHADLFIFTGHESLLWRNADLPLLRILRKRVIWVFLGSDHRPPYLNGKRVREALAAGGGGHARLAELARTYRIIVRRIERRAHAVVAMSSSAQLHARPFIHLLAMGIPQGEEAHDAMPPAAHNGGLRILHSPSDPAKGTEQIRACIAGLARDGVQLDYREISERPHREVLDAIDQSDFVVDQLFSDSPLAVFATEAAYRGRAVVVGGYYADEIAADVAPELIPPSRYVSPDRMCAAIEELSRDPDTRTAVAANLARFVRQRWSRAAVARRYLQVAFDPPPHAWLYEPARLRYVHGWGLSEQELRDCVAELVRHGGPSALALDDHPALRDRLIALSAPAGGE